MAAPDKIYVHITPHLRLLEATAIPVDAPEEQEYIRKDALLEWANKNNKRIDTEEGDYSLGYVSAMIDIIEKIELL